MRSPGRLLAALAAAELLLAVALAVAGGPGQPAPRGSPDLVSTLLLTDLALCPGTSYSRHPSQADRFAPFSDHPAALEHTPAGSFLPVPPAAVPPSRRSP